MYDGEGCIVRLTWSAHISHAALFGVLRTSQRHVCRDLGQSCMMHILMIHDIAESTCHLHHCADYLAL